MVRVVAGRPGVGDRRIGGNRARHRPLDPRTALPRVENRSDSKSPPAGSQRPRFEPVMRGCETSLSAEARARYAG